MLYKVILNTCVKIPMKIADLIHSMYFFQLFLGGSSLDLNVMLFNCTGIMNIKCFILSLIGDVLIYSQIIMFLYTFSEHDHDLLEDEDRY